MHGKAALQSVVNVADAVRVGAARAPALAATAAAVLCNAFNRP